MRRKTLADIIGAGTALMATIAISSPTLAETPPPAPRSFTFAAVGDLLPESPVLAAATRAAKGTGRRYDFAPLFARVAPLVSGVDLAVCHLEIPLGRPGQRPGRYGKVRGFNRLLGPYELAAGVAATGFDRCSTASNHSYDLGDAGVDSSLAALDEAGLTHTGTARTVQEVQQPPIEVNGVRVAHLSYTNLSNAKLAKGQWRVAVGDVERVVADVESARSNGAEVVILSIHMGVEGASKPSKAQRAWVQAITARTHVDLVVMHHPHTIEPVELVNGTWVFWSVGNFVSGMGPGYGHAALSSARTLDGLLALARFDEDPAQPGHFVTTVTPVAICTDPSTRAVYPATATLNGPPISTKLRRVVSACWRRTIKVVPLAA